jgi:hypothetical protein
MTLMWGKLGESWQLLSPQGYPDEMTLHNLISKAPQMLPLSGGPRLTIVGSEVYLGGNYVDLLGVEDNGRLAIIEIKLSMNAEARRAVIAQILAYAASFKGMNRATLEHQVLASQLAEAKVASLSDAVAQEDQSGQFDAEAFDQTLEDCLLNGTFRLVLVLDEAPPELTRLVGYLESMTDGLIIDLITVSMFDIEGRQVVVPRRVDPIQETAIDHHKPKLLGGVVSTPKPQLVEGAEPFASSLHNAPDAAKATLQRLLAFANELEAQGLANLWTTVGTSGRWILNPRLPGDQVGLVSIYNEQGGYLVFYRSVFERRAPHAITRIESLIPSGSIGQGTSTHMDEIPDNLLAALLAALIEAYREATHGETSTVAV